MLEPQDVTLVTDAVHNPAEPRHFMQLVPAGRRYTATIAGRVVADSEAATVCKEVGRSICDPVVYFPRADVDMDALARIDRTTHCPLKGDTEYFDIVVGETTASAAAWSYVEMIPGAEALLELVAFDVAKVVVA